MKALTLIQPWAFAIAFGGKRIENRGAWRDLCRGTDALASRGILGERIAIHAGKKVPREADIAAVCDALWPGRVGPKSLPLMAKVTGGIVAVARPVAVIRAEEPLERTGGSDHWPVYKPRREDVLAAQVDAEQVARWWFGPYAIVLDDVVPLVDPVAVTPKFGLGFWQVPEDVERVVLAQVERVEREARA